MKRLLTFLALATLAAGCATPTAPASRAPGQVVVQVRQPEAGLRKLSAKAPQAIDDLRFVTVDLYDYNGSEECEGKECYPQTAFRLLSLRPTAPPTTIGPIAKADAGKPIVFTGLLAGGSYGVRAKGWDADPTAAEGEATDLTDYDAQGIVEFTVDADGSAQVSVPLKLIPYAFSGTAEADLPVIDDTGSEVVGNGEDEEITVGPMPT